MNTPTPIRLARVQAAMHVPQPPLAVREATRRCLFLLTLVLVLPTWAADTWADGTLGRGTAWETNYYVRTSDRAGPTVVITGGLHGDEPAGAAAAEQIRHWPLACGTLAVLPRANPPALAARTRNTPEVDKTLGNLNRNFPKAGQAGPAVGDQAAAIWEWVQSLQPAWVVDLHEGSGIRAAGSKSVGSSAIVCPRAETDQAAQRMLAAVNATIERPDKQFVRLSPPIDGSLARAAGEHLAARAMIVETSINDLPPPAAKDGADAKQNASTVKPRQQPLSRRIRQHRVLVQALLVHLGMLDPGLNIDRLTGRSAAADKTWVALYDAGGTGGDGASSVQRILSRSGMQVVRVGAEEIAAGSLAEFDLVVFPGGSGSKEAAAIGEAGREQVRQFVERGGGYIGICAGAYGQGRVLFVSPHPEQTAGLEDLVRRAAEWTAGKP